MAKIGRNAPCPCGSGKKYKQCCLAVDQDAHRAGLTPVAPEPTHETLPLEDYDYEELERLSNRVPDLLTEGRVDEAEEVCLDLLRRFPDAVDGTERLGHVYEVRGDLTTAALHYRSAAAFIRQTEEPENEHAVWLDQLADRIDPP